jgi:hypothetical protein
MKSFLNCFKLFNCGSNAYDLNELLTKEKQKVCDLELQSLSLVNQIQELKAINHYQTFDLERTISKLEELLSLRVTEVDLLEKENHSLKEKIEARKRRRAERARIRRQQKGTND